MPTLTTLTPRQDAAHKLAKAAAALELNADKDDETIKRSLASLDEARRNFSRIFHGRSAASVSDFFKAVGLGVRSAQEELDKQAAEDARVRVEQEVALRNRQPGDPVDLAALAAGPATMFRIPRVTAELKYTLETVTEKGFDIVFLSDTEKQSEQQQQTIQLEIVAVPVPPDYINTLRKLAEPEPGDGEVVRAPRAARREVAPGGMFFEALVGPEEAAAGEEPPEGEPEALPSGPAHAARRADPWAAALAGAVERVQVRHLVEEADRKAHGERKTLVKRFLLPQWEQAIVVDDKKGGHFVLLAVLGKAPEMALWHMLPAKGSLRLLHRSHRETSTRRIHDFAAALCHDLAASRSA